MGQRVREEEDWVGHLRSWQPNAQQLAMTQQPVPTAPTPRRPGIHDTRPLWRTYLAFLGPMIVGNVLQALSGTFNSVFVGQMLGTQALAATSAVFPIVFFFVSLVIGIGAGGSVLIGQAWGAHEAHKVKAIAGTAITL